MRLHRLALFIVGLAACLSLGACGSTPTHAESVHALATKVSGDQQILAQIDALPADQQKQFINAHMVQVRHLMDDPDPKVRQRFAELVKQP